MSLVHNASVDERSGPRALQTALEQRAAAPIPVVVKTHGKALIDPFDGMAFGDDVVLFASVRERHNNWEVNRTARLAQAVRVQSLAEVSKKGWACELDRIAQLFNLSTTQHILMHQYFRSWTVMRQCCSLQMSVDQRNELHGVVDERNDSSAGGGLRHPFDSFGYVGCAMYNLAEVERLYARATLTRMQEANPSKHKHMLRGRGQCAENIAQISSGLDFNGKPWAQRPMTARG